MWCEFDLCVGAISFCVCVYVCNFFCMCVCAILFGECNLGCVCSLFFFYVYVYCNHFGACVFVLCDGAMLVCVCACVCNFGLCVYLFCCVSICFMCACKFGLCVCGTV